MNKNIPRELEKLFAKEAKLYSDVPLIRQGFYWGMVNEYKRKRNGNGNRKFYSTKIVKTNGDFSVKLTINVYSFFCGTALPMSKQKAEWNQTMLCKALDSMIEKVS